MLRTMLVGCFCFALAASDVIAQVPVPRTPVDAKVSVTIALEIGSESYKSTSHGAGRFPKPVRLGPGSSGRLKVKLTNRSPSRIAESRPSAS